MASTAFRRAQLGIESTRGTAVAATMPLVNGIFTANPTAEYDTPEEDRNSLAERHSLTQTRREVEWQWAGPTDFNQLLHFLNMGLMAEPTPTQPDNTNWPNTYLWSYIPRLNVSNAQDAYTIEWGDDTQAFEANFCMASQISLRWNMGETVQITVDGFGRDPDKSGSFTGSLSAPVIENAISLKTFIWIDGLWANLGTTLKSGLLRSFELTIPTGIQRYHTAEGLIHYNTFVEQKRAASVQLSYLTSAGAMTEYDKWVAGTSAAIRVQVQGSVVDVYGGGSDSVKYIEFNGNVKYDEDPELFTDDEGKTLVNLRGHSYDDHIDNSSSEGNSGKSVV